MTGEITSPTSPLRQEVVRWHSAGDEWRAFAAFLKSPALPDQVAQSRDGARAVVRMLGLDVAFLFVFVAVLILLVAAGVELPENLNSSLELNAGTIFLIVIGAPVVEELVFRGWLSGRPRALIIIPILLTGGLIAAFGGVSNTGEDASLWAGLTALGTVLTAAIAMAAVWKRAPMGWFKTIFPGAFWMSSIAFALVHFANYTEGSFLVLLPLVLPQFVLGSIAAYLRVHYGLWTAIALHAVHNGLAIGIAALAMTTDTGG